MKRNKYYNRKTNGYDSKKESKRAVELQTLENNGYISHLEEQKKFELQPSFKILTSEPPIKEKTIRAITYFVDFYYYDNEKKRWVAEDVKGFKTDVYKIKSKIFQYTYRDILFLET
jgi:hypothetical protein